MGGLPLCTAKRLWERPNAPIDLPMAGSPQRPGAGFMATVHLFTVTLAAEQSLRQSPTFIQYQKPVTQ